MVENATSRNPMEIEPQIMVPMSAIPTFSLTAARINRGLSQKEFAEECGVSESTANAWETGKRYPSPKKLSQIERVLGISLNFVRFGK